MSQAKGDLLVSDKKKPWMCLNRTSAENLVKGGDSSFHMQIMRASHWPEAVNLSDIRRHASSPLSLFPCLYPSREFIVHWYKVDSFYFWQSLSSSHWQRRCFVNVTRTMFQRLLSCCTKSSPSHAQRVGRQSMLKLVFLWMNSFIF